MGDADLSEVIMPDAEFEEIFGDFEQYIFTLFAFMWFQQERISYAMPQFTSSEKMRRCFTALNLFVVPVIIAIGISFAFTGGEYSYEVEAALKTVIVFLMYVSGIIGLPLYLISLWKVYFSDNDVEDYLGRETTGDNETEGDRLPGNRNGNGLSLAAEAESIIRLSERFRTFAGRRIRPDAVPDHERRENQVGQDPQESSTLAMPGSDETPANFNNSEVLEAAQNLVDLDFDIFSKVDGPVSETNRPELSQSERDDSYDLKVIILNGRDDLSVEIDRDEETDAKSGVEEAKNDCLATEDSQSHAVRTVAVENVGEGDNSYVFLKDSIRN